MEAQQSEMLEKFNEGTIIGVSSKLAADIIEAEERRKKKNNITLAKLGKVTGHPEKRWCSSCEKMQDWFKGNYCAFCKEHKFVKYGSNSFIPEKDMKIKFGGGGRKPKTK